MNFDSPIENELSQFKDSIENFTIKDFDGHTDFIRLTPDDKLMWLSQTAQFFYQYSGKAVRSE